MKKLYSQFNNGSIRERGLLIGLLKKPTSLQVTTGVESEMEYAGYIVHIYQDGRNVVGNTTRSAKAERTAIECSTPISSCISPSQQSYSVKQTLAGIIKND